MIGKTKRASEKLKSLSLARCFVCGCVYFAALATVLLTSSRRVLVVVSTNVLIVTSGEAAGDLGAEGSLLSVADVDSAEALERYRAAKRAAAAAAMNPSSGARIAPAAT